MSVEQHQQLFMCHVDLLVEFHHSCKSQAWTSTQLLFMCHDELLVLFHHSCKSQAWTVIVSPKLGPARNSWAVFPLTWTLAELFRLTWTWAWPVA